MRRQTPAELLKDAVTAVSDDVELTRVGDLEDCEHRPPARRVRPDELAATGVERLEAARETAVEELLVVVEVEGVEVDARAAHLLLDPQHLAAVDGDRLAGHGLERDLETLTPVVGKRSLEHVRTNRPPDVRARAGKSFPDVLEEHAPDRVFTSRAVRAGLDDAVEEP